MVELKLVGVQRNGILRKMPGPQKSKKQDFDFISVNLKAAKQHQDTFILKESGKSYLCNKMSGIGRYGHYACYLIKKPLPDGSFLVHTN